MSAYPVTLLWEKSLPEQVVRDTAAWFSLCPGPIAVTVADSPLSFDAGTDHPLEWDRLFSAIRQERRRLRLAETTFAYLLTATPNENNWFAAEDPADMRSGFGHLADFSWITTAPSSAIGAHYLLKGIFNALLDDAGVDWEAMWHREPQGCLFDFCGLKSDLALKLRTGDICGDCLTILRESGLPDPLLRQAAHLMDMQRRRAVNIAQFFEHESGFSNWPFPVAVTRHKIAHASNELHRLLLLLDHFDSLVRFVVLTSAVDAGHSLEIPERPSLGWWVDCLASSHGDEPSLREVLRIAEHEGVVALRNETRGHGWMAMDAHSYRQIATTLEKIIREIEDRLTPILLTRRLVVPKSTRVENGNYVVRGTLLMGSNMLSPTFEAAFRDPIAAGIRRERDVHLADPKMASFKSMDPLIVSAMCPECRHERLLLTDGGRRYIDALVGHRVTLPVTPRLDR